MSRAVFDELCPPEYRDLGEFALRHHDYIKDVFLGEMPAAPSAGALDALPSEQRAIGYAALGCIQVAGAASLGVGRLTAFRVAIFDVCVHGDPLADQRAATRLARLCTPDPERTPTRDDVDVAPSPGEVDLLDQLGLHGWHHRTVSLDDHRRRAILEELAAREPRVEGRPRRAARLVPRGSGCRPRRDRAERSAHRGRRRVARVCTYALGRTSRARRRARRSADRGPEPSTRRAAPRAAARPRPRSPTRARRHRR